MERLMKQLKLFPSMEAKTKWVYDFMRSHNMDTDRSLSELTKYELVIDPDGYDKQCLAEWMATTSTTIEIMHPARVRHGDLSILVSKVVNCNNSNKVRKFIDEMKNYAENRANHYHPANEVLAKEMYTGIVGDIFEVFVEYLIKTHGSDVRIGVTDYHPINESNGEEDYGVDGYGIGTNGKPATVQIKFRSDHNHILTANEDRLTNFKNNSHEVFKVDTNDHENMVVITTAKDIHHITRDKMLNNKVKVITLAGIEKLLAYNDIWWKNFMRHVQPPHSVATIQQSAKEFA